MRYAELSEKVLCKVDARPVAEAVAVHVRNGFRSKVSIYSFLSEIRALNIYVVITQRILTTFIYAVIWATL